MAGETHKAEGAPAPAGDELTLSKYIAERAKLERSGDTAGVQALQARARTAMQAATSKGLRWR